MGARCEGRGDLDRGNNTELSAHCSDERWPALRCSRRLPTAAGGVIGGAIAYHRTGFAATPTTGRSPAGKAATQLRRRQWQNSHGAETPGHELRHHELRRAQSLWHDATSNPHEAARPSARLHHGNRPGFTQWAHCEGRLVASGLEGQLHPFRPDADGAWRANGLLGRMLLQHPGGGWQPVVGRHVPRAWMWFWRTPSHVAPAAAPPFPGRPASAGQLQMAIS